MSPAKKMKSTTSTITSSQLTQISQKGLRTIPSTPSIQVHADDLVFDFKFMTTDQATQQKFVLSQQPEHLRRASNKLEERSSLELTGQNSQRVAQSKSMDKTTDRQVPLLPTREVDVNMSQGTPPLHERLGRTEFNQNVYQSNFVQEYQLKNTPRWSKVNDYGNTELEPFLILFAGGVAVDRTATRYLGESIHTKTEVRAQNSNLHQIGCGTKKKLSEAKKLNCSSKSISKKGRLETDGIRGDSNGGREGPGEGQGYTPYSPQQRVKSGPEGNQLNRLTDGKNRQKR